jgi:hypothetical protein
LESVWSPPLLRLTTWSAVVLPVVHPGSRQ